MSASDPSLYPRNIDREGIPYTSLTQARLLKALHDPTARPSAQPFRALDLKALGLPCQARTSIQSLIARDWIVDDTKGFPDMRYKTRMRQAAQVGPQ